MMRAWLLLCLFVQVACGPSGRPNGNGPTLTYGAYDPVAGLAPNEVAILFLGGGTGASPLCPVTSAMPTSSITGTGIGESFEISTDVPVVAYQINPYGGGSAAVT